eukprot:502392-Pelagomonas_calceolata.AAC.1
MIAIFGPCKQSQRTRTPHSSFYPASTPSRAPSSVSPASSEGGSFFLYPTGWVAKKDGGRRFDASRSWKALKAKRMETVRMRGMSTCRGTCTRATAEFGQADGNCEAHEAEEQMETVKDQAHGKNEEEGNVHLQGHMKKGSQARNG